MKNRLLARAAGMFVGLTVIVGGAQAADKVIRIGVLDPQSGPASYFGVQVKAGMDLAIEQLNKAKVNGYTYEIDAEDSACSPLQATNLAKKLVNDFKPDVVVGEWCSDASLAIAPILQAAKIPTINVNSSTDKLTEMGNKYMFRIFPTATMQNQRLATGALDKMHAKTAVILYEKTNAGLDLAASFEKTFTAGGGKVLAKIDFGKDVNDFTSIATRIAALGPVDVLPSYGIEGQIIKLTQALAQAKVIKSGGGTGTPLGTIYLPYGSDEKGGPSFAGYIRIVEFDPTEKRPVVQDFVSAFKAKYGANVTPTHVHAQSYDAIMMIAKAVNAGANTPETFREQFSKMKNVEMTTGTITFDAKGQNIDPSSMHFVETNKDYSWTSLAW